MSTCFSLTEVKNGCYRSTFYKSGLRPTLTDLQDNATVIHLWVPKTPDPARRNLLLIHGLGANALWQWGDVIHHFTVHFNVYVPDILFFGDSYTTRPERSENFQADCIMKAMELNGAVRMMVAGLSYGGFVAYSAAARYKERIERLVVCCSGICMEENDLKNGVQKLSDLEEAARILVPLSPDKLKELVGFTFYRAPPVCLVPNCFLNDFIDAMCRENAEEKKELIRAIPQNRKLSNIPKITQPTLIVWGEHDQIFTLELAYRLKRHLGDKAHLAVIKKAGHALNVERPKEYLMLLKSFLIYLQLPPENPDFNYGYREIMLTDDTEASSKIFH